MNKREKVQSQIDLAQMIWPEDYERHREVIRELATECKNDGVPATELWQAIKDFSVKQSLYFMNVYEKEGLQDPEIRSQEICRFLMKEARTEVKKVYGLSRLSTRKKRRRR